MTPEKRAEVIRRLRSTATGAMPLQREALEAAADELEAGGKAPRLPPLPQLPILSKGWDGQPELLAKMLAPKPSESSMVQRIETLETALRQVIARASAEKICAHSPATKDAMAGIMALCRAALEGPPDPERDREQRSEVERP